MPEPTATPTPDGAGQPIAGSATPYSDSLAGNPLGCGGIYDPEDATVVAVSLAHNLDWPCGTLLGIWGPAGQIIGVRQDTCPGCTDTHLDLSRAAFEIVCGAAASACPITIVPLPSPD